MKAMIRIIRLVGYVWLFVVAIIVMGTLGVGWLNEGLDKMIASFSLEYALIICGAVLPGILLVVLEIKEERVEKQEEET
jgi:hypothetical protein